MRHVRKKSFSSAKVQVPAGLCKKNGGRFVSADLQAQITHFSLKSDVRLGKRTPLCCAAPRL